jgi:hypothetical protein
METLLICAGLLGTFLAPADIEQSTPVLLRLESVVSTRTAKVGDPVDLRTASPMIADGGSIPTGSHVRGMVTRAKRPGRVRGRAELEIGIVSIVRPDGSVLPVTGISSVMEPPRRRLPGRGALPDPAPMIPILAGMVAGYGTSALVSRTSNSGDTIMRAGVVAGLATGVLVGVMKRGEDLVLLPGVSIEVVFERRPSAISPRAYTRSDIIASRSVVHAAGCVQTAEFDGRF